MAALSDQEKLEIVTLLGHFARPVDVVVHMRQHHGVQVDRFQVRSYDPTNPRYEGGAKWLPIFEAARQAYLTSIEGIPITHKAYRLNVLQEGVQAARKAQNWRLVASLLEQAAKEVGRAATTHCSPRMERCRNPSVRELTLQEGRNAFAQLVKRVMDLSRDDSQSAPTNAPSSCKVA